jgi:hypothetical protein
MRTTALGRVRLPISRWADDSLPRRAVARRCCAPAVGQQLNLASSREARRSAVRPQLRNHKVADFIARQ